MSLKRVTILATLALYSTSPREIGAREGIEGAFPESRMLLRGGQR